MDCFKITTVDEEYDGDGAVPRPSAASKVSWVTRSLSVASSSRRSESARDFTDSLEFFTQPRANNLRVFTFGELKAATRGFSRGMMIGEGGFGCVYRGVVRFSDVDDGNCSGSNMDVAVKQLNRNGFQGHKEWINEVNFLGVVKHPNLVKLVGYCAEDDERGIQRLLVYELMYNKSLEDHLFIREVSPLSWMARLRIAQDAARGLAYLHEEMDFQLIFRDLKTSNILLDENFSAKLSDFGLARQGPAAGLSYISASSVVGTAGYAAPEYIQTGRLTAKSDVWSFGVVLYELITGRRAVEKNMPRNEQKLLDWVRPYVSDSRKFHLIVDPRLEGQYCIKSAQKLASLANKCLAKNAKSRPKMSELVEMLGKIISETLSENDSAPQHAKETQGKKEETEKSVRKFNWKNWTLR
ncbi:serine/threonine-protein kinase PCRK2-like [Rhododendron vialii]|uniref:serine/threonine-protein kinase PCRK2-like n=1 Tax=Rhododendron vialii TaxID=182163 RepID=UPI00265FCC45|nr:serine/threonine-protein kinase PCRK2-like [Rhododendron vialii]